MTSCTLPIGQGKRFTATDPVWSEYLAGSEIDTLEGLSMAFFAAGEDDAALLYVLTDNFDSALHFQGDGALSAALNHTFPSVTSHKSYRLRVYPVENTPVAIAKTYQSYVKEAGGIKTLAQKEEENPGISGLYGAPHIYLFDMFLLSEEDINWPSLRQSLSLPVFSHLRSLAEAYLDDSTAFLAVLDELAVQDYADRYQRTVVIRCLSELLRLEEFFDPAVFPGQAALPAGSRPSLLHRNKQALFDALPGVFAPVDTWAADRTVNLLHSISAAGVENAWIGLDNWEQAMGKPELAELAAQLGWLLAPYDSYHSIHPPGGEQWQTAAFSDADLYHHATVQNSRGEYLAGFQGVGRKLNPTLAFPQVELRVNTLLESGIPFTSWFVDCDATGEVYNDYSPAHPTTKESDLAARLERMEWLSREKGLVVGSEGGHDYARNAIAFAHGIELPSFAWMDEDMKSNRDSEYYLGRYYAPNGGVPEKFALQVPVKEEYKAIFMNPRYNIPLYKLVYNNAVITSYHWDWPTLKIAGEIENRQLYEMLYHVPPMYHLDASLWEKHGPEIAAHAEQWSRWSRRITHKEMTGFEVLSGDYLVQLATYEDAAILVNWSDAAYSYGETTVGAKSYQIMG